MSNSLLRRLPIRLPPFRDETLHSYLARLEAANHLQFGFLEAYLRDTASRKGVVAERLAAVTGRPMTILQHALPELRPRRLSPNGLNLHPMAEFDRNPRPACRRCAAACGITVPVIRWVPVHRNLCAKHRRWIGPTNHRADDELDLSCLPDVVAAGRRHRTLVRRHGHRRARRAYNDSLYIALRWAERRDFGQHREGRLALLGFPTDRYWVPAHHRAVYAAVYPEAVTLAGLVASTYWIRVATAADHTERDRFYAEAARRLRLPDYEAYTAFDPLYRWVERYAPAQVVEDEITSRGSLSPRSVLHMD